MSKVILILKAKGNLVEKVITKRSKKGKSYQAKVWVKSPKSEGKIKVGTGVTAAGSKGKIVGGGIHGAYWKEQDSYRVKFENGTTQYISANKIKEGKDKDKRKFKMNNTSDVKILKEELKK